MSARIHCKTDGWGWIGTCPHCSPSCPCGKYCNGPYLAGLDEQGNPQYSVTPVELIEPAEDDDDDDWRERETSEDGHIMWG
jgi:hypothetical protein